MDTRINQHPLKLLNQNIVQESWWICESFKLNVKDTESADPIDSLKDGRRERQQG